MRCSSYGVHSHISSDLLLEYVSPSIHVRLNPSSWETDSSTSKGRFFHVLGNPDDTQQVELFTNITELSKEIKQDGEVALSIELRHTRLKVVGLEQEIKGE